MQTVRLITQMIARIDDHIDAQINAILHHDDFQSLEARWRGLHFLVNSMPRTSEQSVVVKVLCLSTYELSQDCMRASEFDSSVLFKKIYSDEYDKAGGHPFGLLLFDFFFSLNHRVDWVAIAYFISQIAAAAFAPALIAASPHFLGLDDFGALEAGVSIKRTFAQDDYKRWQRLREKEDIRFLNMVLPRVLMRQPHSHFERCESHEDYLWGSPIYTLAHSIAMSFFHTGWFIDFRKYSYKSAMQSPSFDSINQFTYSNLEASIRNSMEADLSAEGLIILMEKAFSDHVSVQSAQSIQVAKRYSNPKASNNALISSMLTYLLCASRFAHYVKVIVRDKLGRFDTPLDCQRFLQDWIFDYCGKADMNNPLQAAKYPLSTAQIQVHRELEHPGKYFCKMEIKPNFHIEKISTKLKFVSRIGAL
jgi:type VI secretion system protein ImpD